MSFEESYYENTDLWVSKCFSLADKERYATIADKLPENIQSLLDVGCGNGLFLKYLTHNKKKRYDRLCGTDRSTIALACVEAEKIQASIDSLPFIGDEFDMVSCMEVLEHLPQEIFISAINELSRVSRRYILICVPYNENLRLLYTECTKCFCRFNPHYHLRKFDQNTMLNLFEAKGFRCLEVFYMHPKRIVPTQIEQTLQFIGAVKRKILRQNGPTMEKNAVCPACGYTLRGNNNTAQTGLDAPNSRAGMSIRSLFKIKSSWRWIGALYERVS